MRSLNLFEGYWHDICNMWITLPFSRRFVPRGRPGAPNRRGSKTDAEVVYKPMVTRSKLTAILSLLVALLQFAGTGAVSVSSSGPASTEYYCCCPGECFCTADCCHHAPAAANSDDSAMPRIGTGNLVLEAPRSCGTWTGVLSRSPDSPKALPATLQRRVARQPDGGVRRVPPSTPNSGSREALRPSSPRAPPASVNVT